MTGRTTSLGSEAKLEGASLHCRGSTTHPDFKQSLDATENYFLKILICIQYSGLVSG